MFERRWIAITEVALAVLFWGASFIATKVALAEISPVTIVWLRFLMGVIILGSAVVLRRQIGLPSGVELAYLALLGAIGITFHQWLQSVGLVTSQASTTAWIVATTPIFMALLGWIFLKEKLGILQIAGIFLAAIGVLLVVTGGDLSQVFGGRFGAPGDLLILISAPNWAVFSILSRRSLAKFPATQMMFYVMCFGWLFTTVLLVTGPGLSEIDQLNARGWLAIIFLGIACSGLAYIFWYDGLQTLKSAQVGAFLYLEPLIAVAVSFVVIGEQLILASILGGAGILLGVWLVNRV